MPGLIDARWPSWHKDEAVRVLECWVQASNPPCSVPHPLPQRPGSTYDTKILQRILQPYNPRQQHIARRTMAASRRKPLKHGRWTGSWTSVAHEYLLGISANETLSSTKVRTGKIPARSRALRAPEGRSEHLSTPGCPSGCAAA